MKKAFDNFFEISSACFGVFWAVMTAVDFHNGNPVAFYTVLLTIVAAVFMIVHAVNSILDKTETMIEETEDDEEETDYDCVYNMAEFDVATKLNDASRREYFEGKKSDVGT